MKKILIAAAFLAMLAAPLRAGVVGSLDDIEVWAGDGKTATNRAALVFQWNIGAVSYSLARGFGWNSGTPTGRDMLQAVDAADTRLSVDYHTGQNAIFGIFYDMNANGSTYTPGVPGVVDYGNPANTIHDTAGSTAEPGDLYLSGWADGFWNYSISGGNFPYYDFFAGSNVTFSSPGSSTYAGVSWQTSPVGDTGRELMDGSWDALSFSVDVFGYTAPAIVQPLSAIPEPSTVALTFFALGALFYAKRRFHSR